MKERGLPLPVAVPGVHARGVYVIYDDGRPLVEAYDGPQIVGMDLHRRRANLWARPSHRAHGLDHRA
jgi:hypothetical protein